MSLPAQSPAGDPLPVKNSACPEHTVPRGRSMRIALQAFLLSRTVLLLLGVLVTRLFYDVPGRDHSPFAIWERWDVLWYVRLADHGYIWQPPPVQSDLAFFPLYPLAMHVLSSLTPLSTFAAGVLLANCCFAAALYLVHRLMLLDFAAESAERSVWYLALFPTSLFFFTAYSESLYLLASVTCLYALRQRRWWPAGVAGVVATLTRQLGVVLLVPFAACLLDAWCAGRLARPAALVRALGGLLLIPAGLLAFMAYLQLRFGDPLLFLRAQAAWQRSLAWPWQGVILEIQHLAHPNAHFPLNTQGALQALAVLDLTFLALFVGLVIAGWRLLPRLYSLYAAAILLVITLNPATDPSQPLALLSMARFDVTCLPPFMVLGLLGRSRGVDRVISISFLALLVLFSILFVRGRWVA